MTPEEIKRKFDDLSRRTATANNIKATAAGQFQAKREELEALIAEIKAAGYDPKNLVAERDRVQKELEAQLAVYERDLAAVEQALATYNTK